MLPGRLHSAADLKPGDKLRADVAIVGSGAGGAAVAAELSRAGLKVAVLEEGRSFAPADLVSKPSWAFRHLYSGRGVMVASGKVLVPLAAGRAVGGSTFINSAICFRAPDSVLREWERDFGSTWTPERMKPLFAEVEKALDVQKIGPEIARRNSLVFKRGAEKLGLEGDFISRNAPGCVGCGVCQLGCPIGGKGSVDKNLLPTAIEHGANVYSEVRVRDLRVEKGVVKGLTAELLDADDERKGLIEVEAARVFLCAGAFGTPQLLQRNKLCGGSGELGENLHVHPGQAAAAIFDEFARSTAGRPNDQSALHHKLLREKGPQQWPYPAMGRTQPRRYEDGQFPTPTGKARLLAREHIEMDDRPSRAFPLILTTGRLLNQWHTRTKTGNVPLLNKLDPAPYLQMHPDDAERLNLHDRQHVAVASRFGQATTFLKLDDSITPGVCFMPIHWNDLWAQGASPNEVASNLRDPISKQPALKAVAVRVTPAAEGSINDQASEDKRIPMIKLEGPNAHARAAFGP